MPSYASFREPLPSHYPSGHGGPIREPDAFASDADFAATENEILLTSPSLTFTTNNSSPLKRALDNPVHAVPSKIRMPRHPTAHRSTTYFLNFLPVPRELVQPEPPCPPNSPGDEDDPMLN